jgi:hypothetical protein
LILVVATSCRSRCSGFASLCSFPSLFSAGSSSYLKSEAILLDRHHEVLHERRIGAKEDVSVGWFGRSLSGNSAVIFAEDKRFDQHQGVLRRAMAGL